MKFVSGEILTEDGFQKGYLGFQRNKIVEVGKGSCPEKPVAKGLIVPTFVNMHTHLGDSFIKYKNIELPRNIEKLVAPPNGLKYKLLKEASENELIEGIEKSIAFMLKSGTSTFCDFREGGLNGICHLKTAIDLWNISSVILSRPEKLDYDKNEIDLLLRNSDGIGLSSIFDWNYSEMMEIAKQTKRKNKIFAIHASERIRENIDSILDLKPDFLVHMVKASESDLICVKENNIPVVLCPRSNAFFGLKPNIDLMEKIGVNILLGTDNAMLSNPSILDEIRYLIKNFKAFEIPEILYKTTYAARKALNLECGILGSNSKADFVVLDDKTLQPLYVSV
ncbi:MAG TPA: N-ethylammeline chlorohydrolase [Bacteroidetes bacterium]|nr:N-ethylammeline chlorohydrolase [Bacteroidota bacterium]